MNISINERETSIITYSEIETPSAVYVIVEVSVS